MELTDEQIAEMVEQPWLESRIEGERHLAAPIIRLDGGATVQLARDIMRALAAEVQQARQRRCGNCAHGRNPGEPLTDYVLCDRLISAEADEELLHRPDWFCADFKAL